MMERLESRVYVKSELFVYFYLGFINYVVWEFVDMV